MGKRRAEIPHSMEKTADAGAGAVAKRTRSSSNALAPPPSRSRSPDAVQPPASSGDDISSADVSTVEQRRRTRSNSNQRLPPPPTPTARKKVSWAISVADTGEEDSKQKDVPDAKMRTRTQPSRRGKGAAALVPAPVRKSTRRKSRPLRRWLGEKFLYTSKYSGFDVGWAQ